MDDIAQHIEAKLNRQYRDGELSDEEYREATDGLISEERVKQNMEEMKHKEYEDLQEQYADDEISEEELEASVERLMETGTDFLDYEEPEPSFSEKNEELMFQLRQWGQIALLVGAFLFVTLMVLFFKSLGLLVVLGITAIVVIYYINKMAKLE